MTPFGTTKDGKTVHRVTIAAGDLTVRLLTFGATLHDVRLAGIDRNLTLASDRLADYEPNGALQYGGSLVGPVANRLADASAPIGDKVCKVEANQDGEHSLHSGSAGTHIKVWEVIDHSPASVTFAVTLPDGEGGFPGNRRITARFSVTAPATLRMEVTGTTDALTIINFANHSYWNLDGTPTWQGHSIKVAADAYLPVGAGVIPTGEVRDVTGTGFDLRHGPVLIPGEPSIDHNFCLSDSKQPLRDVLWLTGTSGVAMRLATTETGVQVYDAGHTIGPSGSLHQGFAIEAQGWPDAPNHPHFPQITVAPDQTYAQVTEWRFSSNAAG